MRHNDPEVLALLALGETDVPPDAMAHLLECAECRDEVERMRRVTRIARENGPVDPRLQDPAPHVWERIRAEIAADSIADGVGVDDARSPLPRPDASGTRRRPRRRLVLGLAAAAAVVLVVGGIAGSFALFAPRPAAQARASLTALPKWAGSSGEATMRRLPGGAAELVVHVDSPATATRGTYCEVWLMNAQLTKLVGVGVLNDGEGRFEMPPGIVAADYPVVDVSIERVDGQVGHAGDSVVRGTLSASG